MGLFGGTIFPLFMGFASDALGQIGAVAIMAHDTKETQQYERFTQQT